ncbi:MAG: tyrosine--tRNA ligase [Planctomycetota bacterium]
MPETAPPPSHPDLAAIDAAERNPLLLDLDARGLIYQCTDMAGLNAHLAQPRTLYNGFDPTADSLTVGNLVAIMLLRRFQAHGHTPIVLMGGATGRIGDPSGKDAERSLMDDEQIEANLAGQRPIFESLLDFDEGTSNHARIVNNHDWFKTMDVYTFLRDVGKHFSVNEMLRRDSVKNRIERAEQGISYTEFSYMLLQAWDFVHLYRELDVTVQTAGADQWGNIVSGSDLIRRLDTAVDDEHAAAVALGLTAPLLTKADGSKFGKSEAGAVWLTHHRPSGEPGTSPYAYTQFWLNAADDDVAKFLKIFTDLAPGDIADLMAAHAEAPHARAAQQTLAKEATTLLHGAAAYERAVGAARALFSGAVGSLDEPTLNEVFAEVPASEHPRDQLTAEGGVALVDLLPQTSLCSSKGEARKHLAAGAVSINGDKLDADDPVAVRVTADDLLHHRVILLRRGKKAWHVTRWT